jgi:peptidase E
MKTKYILHGGNANDPCEENDKFFSEILKDIKGEVKILLVPFATTPDKYEREYNWNTSQFERVRDDRVIKYIQANKKDFLEQIKRADVIYLSGGKTTNAVEALSAYKKLDEIWKGKVVAGESAGMNVLAAYCYSKSTDSVLECLGVLPIKTIPHYREEFAHKLDGVGEGLELLTLAEHEYKVVEV